MQQVKPEQLKTAGFTSWSLENTNAEAELHARARTHFLQAYLFAAAVWRSTAVSTSENTLEKSSPRMSGATFTSKAELHVTHLWGNQTHTEVDKGRLRGAQLATVSPQSSPWERPSSGDSPSNYARLDNFGSQ